MTPEQIAKDSEDSHQTALFCWANLAETKAKYPQLKWLYHCPNGGQRSAATGARLKVMGVKVGVPDICLPVVHKPNWPKPFAGLYIELKIPSKLGSKNGGCSDEQKEWLLFLASQGYAVAVCYGWEDARNRIISYLEGE